MLFRLYYTVSYNIIHVECIGNYITIQYSVILTTQIFLWVNIMMKVITVVSIIIIIIVIIISRILLKTFGQGYYQNGSIRKLHYCSLVEQ